eukprot:TRINITY_DN984_c0_g1_i2.p1 TRINITY_DN984_c0_g1~~TRINITY_DN984_c0_g1_i2.p1  ORF type:complete len:553 (+),score=116.30 TRINITY_DN984_c0_g1_i2:54-1712(+)
MVHYCELHGGATERGLRIGKLLSAEIHQFYDFFLKETFLTTRDSEMEIDLLDIAILHSALVRSIVPDAAQELDAISVSAKISYERLLLMNLYYEQGANAQHHKFPSEDSIASRNVPVLKSEQVWDVLFQTRHELGLSFCSEVSSDTSRALTLIGQTQRMTHSAALMVLYKHHAHESHPPLFFIAPPGIVGGAGMSTGLSVTWFPKPLSISPVARRFDRSHPQANPNHLATSASGGPVTTGSNGGLHLQGIEASNSMTGTSASMHHTNTTHTTSAFPFALQFSPKSPLACIGADTTQRPLALALSGAFLARWMLQHASFDNLTERLHNIRTLGTHTFHLASSTGTLRLLQHSPDSGWRLRTADHDTLSLHPLTTLHALCPTAPAPSARRRSLSALSAGVHASAIPISTALPSTSASLNPLSPAIHPVSSPSGLIPTNLSIPADNPHQPQNPSSEAASPLDFLRESIPELAALQDESKARMLLATEALQNIRSAPPSDEIHHLKELVQILSQSTDPEFVPSTPVDHTVALILLPKRSCAIIGVSYQDEYDLVQL